MTRGNQGPESEKSRIDALGSRLQEARRQRSHDPLEAEEGRSARAAGMGAAMRVMIDFVAPIGVAAFLGWWIDRLAGTAPWVMVALLCVGMVAGVMNVWRLSRVKNTGSSKDDEG